MEKKNKTLLYVVGVLLVIGVGISLAYFAAAILTRGNGAVTNVKTANIGDTTIVTEGNVEFTDTDIYPGHKNISKIKITATGQGDVSYHLIWKGENTLQTSLNYTLYKSSTDENPNVACTKKSQGNLTKILYEECTNSGFDNLEQITTGTIATATTETTFRLKEDESITASAGGTVVYYYVVLEFPNEQASQNFDANGRFEGETNIEVPDANDPVVPGISVDDIIAKLNIKTSIPDFTKVATKTETELEDDGTDNNGIFETDDPMYGTGKKTYYWRGAATTNHVIFDNKCWRIVRINGDGSIRLIYNGVPSGTTCSGNGVNVDSIVLPGTKYNTSYDNNSYVGWTYTVGSQRPSTNASQTSGVASSIKTELENWYSSNITYKSKVAKGKFCNDRNMENGTTWEANPTYEQSYAAYVRLRKTPYAPTLACSDEDIYDLNIGAITADEVMFAGGGAGSTMNNVSYYLYNGQFYWTMSPYNWSGYMDGNNAAVFYVYNNGSINGNYVGMEIAGLRPVINLLSSTQFETGGNGTADNPYVVQI